MSEVICETCKSVMKQKKGKAKTLKSQTIPTSGSCSSRFAPTTSGIDYTASRLGGAKPERPVLRFVTYVCETCKNEKIIEGYD